MTNIFHWIQQIQRKHLGSSSVVFIVTGTTAIEVVIINQCHRQQKTNTHTFDSVRTKNQPKEDRNITLRTENRRFLTPTHL